MNKQHFANTRISHFPRSTVVVTSKDTNGEVGAATISWCGIISSQPPVLSVSFLPDSFTRRCIMDSREFVVNVPDINFLEETNFIGSLSGNWESKMSKMKEELNKALTLSSSIKINSPLISEFYLNFECRVLNVNQVGLYDCFFGLVLNMSCNKELYSTQLHPKGYIEYNNISPIICLADQYWSVGKQKGISTENKTHPHGNTH